jgi:hypothetical protein
VVGWRGIWERFTGWWTPGWGNLFTVLVATAALGIGAWFNIRTLQRTDDRFTQGRIDARNDKLRVAIAGLFSALSERLSINGAYTQRMAGIPKPSGPDAATLREWGKQGKIAVEDTMAPLTRRIGEHILIILMLTTDENIIGPVEKLERITTEELADLRKIMEKAVRAKDLTDAFKGMFSALGAGIRGLPRQGEIDALTKQLRDYCRERLPVA